MDPLEVNDGNDTDAEINVACHVHFLGVHGPVEALVIEEVRAFLNLSPRREGPGRGSVYCFFLDVVYVGAGLPGAVLTVLSEQFLEAREVIGFGAKMAGWQAALRDRFLVDCLHFRPIVFGGRNHRGRWLR